MKEQNETVTFEQRRLSDSGSKFVIIPRDYQVVSTLPDGTILLQWFPLDVMTSGYAEKSEEAA